MNYQFQKLRFKHVTKTFRTHKNYSKNKIINTDNITNQVNVYKESFINKKTG